VLIIQVNPFIVASFMLIAVNQRLSNVINCIDSKQVHLKG